ncbi:MAG: hypothetical protein GY826_44140, partial [Fuerstiella sp.]|nr:hypothetical protein [Fuerstiella sp.]
MKHPAAGSHCLTTEDAEAGDTDDDAEFGPCLSILVDADDADTDDADTTEDDSDADTSLHSCKWNRDVVNNVCVHPPVGHTDMPTAVQSCNNVVNGVCPTPWEVSAVFVTAMFLCLFLQVPNGCCSEQHLKYETLLTASPGFVCCNAPCTSLEVQNNISATADLLGLPKVVTMTGREVTHGDVCSALMGSSNCAPGMRSYMVGMAGVGGIVDYNMQRNTMGMYGGRPYYGGQVTHGYGGRSYKQMMELAAGIRGMNQADYGTTYDQLNCPALLSFDVLNRRICTLVEACKIRLSLTGAMPSTFQ